MTTTTPATPTVVETVAAPAIQQPVGRLGEREVLQASLNKMHTSRVNTGVLTGIALGTAITALVFGILLGPVGWFAAAGALAIAGLIGICKMWYHSHQISNVQEALKELNNPAPAQVADQAEKPAALVIEDDGVLVDAETSPEKKKVVINTALNQVAEIPARGDEPTNSFDAEKAMALLRPPMPTQEPITVNHARLVFDQFPTPVECSPLKDLCLDSEPLQVIHNPLKKSRPEVASGGRVSNFVSNHPYLALAGLALVGAMGGYVLSKPIPSTEMVPFNNGTCAARSPVSTCQNGVPASVISGSNTAGLPKFTASANNAVMIAPSRELEIIPNGPQVTAESNRIMNALGTPIDLGGTSIAEKLHMVPKPTLMIAPPPAPATVTAAANNSMATLGTTVNFDQTVTGSSIAELQAAPYIRTQQRVLGS